MDALKADKKRLTQERKEATAAKNKTVPKATQLSPPKTAAAKMPAPPNKPNEAFPLDTGRL